MGSAPRGGRGKLDPEWPGDPRAHEVAQGLRAALHQVRQHPHARCRWYSKRVPGSHSRRQRAKRSARSWRSVQACTASGALGKPAVWVKKLLDGDPSSPCSPKPGIRSATRSSSRSMRSCSSSQAAAEVTALVQEKTTYSVWFVAGAAPRRPSQRTSAIRPRRATAKRIEFRCPCRTSCSARANRVSSLRESTPTSSGDAAKAWGAASAQDTASARECVYPEVRPGIPSVASSLPPRPAQARVSLVRREGGDCLMEPTGPGHPTAWDASR